MGAVLYVPSYTGTVCVTPSPESRTTPVVRPDAYRERIAWVEKGRGKERVRECEGRLKRGGKGGVCKRAMVL